MRYSRCSDLLIFQPALGAQWFSHITLGCPREVLRTKVGRKTRSQDRRLQRPFTERISNTLRPNSRPSTTDDMSGFLCGTELILTRKSMETLPKCTRTTKDLRADSCFPFIQPDIKFFTNENVMDSPWLLLLARGGWAGRGDRCCQ